MNRRNTHGENEHFILAYQQRTSHMPKTRISLQGDERTSEASYFFETDLSEID